jgi:hypothetical protein
MAMTHNRLLALLVYLLVTACGADAEQLSPAACNLETELPAEAGEYPYSELNLANWSLTLPVDDNGGTTGTADTVSPGELLDGYFSDWFYATIGGGVTFWAPVTGARTPNARYSRSELRELIDPEDSSVNWLVTGKGRLEATVSVERIPSGSGKAIVGKIVGYDTVDSDSNYLVHLVFQVRADTCAGSLYALVQDDPVASLSEVTQVMLVEDGLSLGESFSYTIDVDQGELTVSARGQTKTVTIDPKWNEVPVYFRVGAGLSATGTQTTDGVAVTVYNLAVTH